MSLDFTPGAVAAPRSSRVLRHAAMEASLMVRNGEQLILALVIPVGALVVGMVWGERFGLDVQAFGASVLALAVWSTSFTSLAITTSFERRYGVLERLVATPLTQTDLVAGKALATSGVAAVQLLVLAIIGFSLGWRPTPTPAQTFVVAACVLLAMVAFAGFALALAGRLRAEATLAVANLVYLVVAAGGALVLPLHAYPVWAQPVLGVLPFAALGEGLRAWSHGVTLLSPMFVLALWAMTSLLIARKAFRWMS